MTPESRATLILEAVHRAGRASVEKLAAKLNTSAATIRRDLSELERRGLLRREHGAAVTITAATFFNCMFVPCGTVTPFCCSSAIMLCGRNGTPVLESPVPSSAITRP